MIDRLVSEMTENSEKCLHAVSLCTSRSLQIASFFFDKVFNHVKQKNIKCSCSRCWNLWFFWHFLLNHCLNQFTDAMGLLKIELHHTSTTYFSIYSERAMKCFGVGTSSYQGRSGDGAVKWSSSPLRNRIKVRQTPAHLEKGPLGKGPAYLFTSIFCDFCFVLSNN